MTAPRPFPIRYRIEPRGVPPIKAARRLGLTGAAFRDVLPRLLARGFPTVDPDTGMFDLKKIDLWMDGPDLSTGSARTRDARDVVNERLSRI
jgi:hypothetical protein